MHDAFILSAARTPIGKFLGVLSSIPATELGAIAVRESLRRAAVDPAHVDEVVLGMILSAGAGQAPARQAALKAGLPATIAPLTINKVCGSGLKAVMLAAQAIRAGDARCVVAGGMESMSRAPHLMRGLRDGIKFGNTELEDTMIADGLWCALEGCHMGAHAEHTARSCGVSRADQDGYALESQTRACQAQDAGSLAPEIVPVTVKLKGKDSVVAIDEGPRRDTTLEGLSKLKPAFDSAGTVTAGNASILSDGAAAVVVVGRELADRSAAPWKARIVAYHTSGVEPRDIFIAPISAIQGVLDKAGLKSSDVDLFEINEAFAAQMVACLRGLNLDPARVNVSGGGISLGHPIGASGARVLVTLLHALHRRNARRGVASLCLGGGNAVAMVVEMVK